MSFIASIQGNELIVWLKKTFRNKEWANEFGTIQTALSKKEYGNVIFDKVLIDFSKCTWVDPMPLLSLLITLYEFKRNGGRSTILLPIVDKHRSSDTDKVMKFFYEEGFLEQFSYCSTISDNETVIIDRNTDPISTDMISKYESKIKSYQKFNTTLFYTNSTLLPAIVIDTKKEFRNEITEVDSWVDNQIFKLRSKISDKVPVYSQGTILHRLTNILVEMLQNIIKHAYNGTAQTYAAIYVRYRYGKENNFLSIEEIRNIDRALNDEETNCPRLSREFLDLRKGCLEVFVIDQGIGFTESLRNNLPNHNVQYPFRESFKHVFIDGLRKKYDVTPNSTKNGGLYLIGEMLTANQDYLCGKDENEWVGSFFPLDNYWGSFYGIDLRKEKVQGLCWIVRLSWKAEADINKSDWTSWNGVPKNHPAYRELEEDSIRVNQKTNSALTFDPLEYPILDQRFSSYSNSKINPVKPRNTKDFFFFLPSINQTKHKLWKTLINIASDLSDSDSRTLIICDIPENEKRTYTYILNDIYFKPNDPESKWLEKFSNIVLVSKRLSICALKKKNNTYHIISSESRSLYFESIKLETFSPHLSIRHFIAWIRAYDSVIFWTNVKQHNSQKQFFVNNDITWNNELKKIDGYLNFAQTITDTLCLAIYKHSIERSIGFYPTETESTLKYTYIKQLDALTTRLVDEYNSIFFNETDSSNRNVLYTGSVFVSGMSLHDALFYSENEKNSENVLPIYFFKHANSLTPVPHLLNWPKQAWLLANKNFPRTNLNLQRVGRTHVIAEHGYKFYKIPRYDEFTKESVYFRNPKETYRDWQNPLDRLVSFGHFDFEGKHDLFKVNLVKKLNESFDYKEELAKFLVSEFFYLLGGFSQTELTPEGLKYWDYLLERKPDFTINDEVVLIAYPNNAHSSLAIDKIKDCFKSSLTDRIFSLMPINKERIGSSLLISPLVFTPIAKLIQTQSEVSKRKVLLFDSTVISGRTRKEIKHLLISLGASEVRTLSIIDRFRLPFKTPDKKKHFSFWRFDIPRLGPRESCPLCQALDEISKFKEDLASEFAKERIDVWIEQWKTTSHFNPIPNGFNPTAIDPITKNFGIEFDEHFKEFKQIISEDDKQNGVDNRIEIINSLGLSIFASELHSMTSKDDIAISLCNKIVNLPDKSIIELISSQLLLYSNEYSSHNQFEMVLRLFTALNNRDYIDNHTALAAIVLISQTAKLHQKLIKELFNPKTKPLIINNIDVEILLAYIYKESIDEKNLFSEKSLRLLKFKDDFSVLHRYKQLHSEIYSEHGKIHTKPLITFYLKKDEIAAEKRLLELNISLSKTRFLLSKITEFRKSSFTARFSLQEKEKCENNLLDCFSLSKLLLERYIKQGLAPEKSPQYNLHLKQLESTVEKELVPNLRHLHSFLFCPVSNENDESKLEHPLKDELGRILKSITESEWKGEAKKKIKLKYVEDIPIVKVTKHVPNLKSILVYNRSNAWMVLDDLIEDEILYLISNAIHSTTLIPDIWSFDLSNTEKAHMWIGLDYEPSLIRIKFVNTSDSPSSEIENITRMKKKPGVIHLEENLKGRYKVEEISNEFVSEKLIQISIEIPII